LVSITGKGFEPEAPSLGPVTFPGLVMPRPLLLTGLYPTPEQRLPKLMQAIRESVKANPPALPGPAVPDALLTPKDFDPFNAAGDQVIRVQLPKHCLLRVLDVTVEPGNSYQYRLRVRMANPNQGRGSSARAIVSAWYECPEPVVVPPDVTFYAVDQK